MTKTKRTSANSVRMEEHVDEIVSSIGPKVKRLRQEQRLSLQQLAVKAEVSAAAIHKIERNDMVPDHHHAAQGRLGSRPPGDLLRRAGWRSARPGCVHTGLGPPGRVHPARGSDPRRRVRPLRPVSQCGGARHRRRPARTVATSRSSTRVRSWSSRLEGTLAFDIAGTRHEVGAGDALHFMGDQPHHWVNEGKAEARAPVDRAARLMTGRVGDRLLLSDMDL